MPGKLQIQRSASKPRHWSSRCSGPTYTSGFQFCHRRKCVASVCRLQCTDTAGIARCSLWVWVNHRDAPFSKFPAAYRQILTSAWKPDWTLPCEIGKEPRTGLLLTLKTELDSCKGTRTTPNTVSTLLL